jgi:hypothetical protein
LCDTATAAINMSSKSHVPINIEAEIVMMLFLPYYFTPFSKGIL